MTSFKPMTDCGRALAPHIDHTLLRANAGPADVEHLCAEARAYGFAAVCVNSALLPGVVTALAGSSVAPCTVAGFPLGASTSRIKAFEAADAAALGAREVDMVLAVWALKAGLRKAVYDDSAGVVRAAGSACAIKVILETCLLTDDEKRLACQIAVDAGARFVKTSTGLAGGGATVADIRLMRATVGPSVGVKASGGIRSLADALALREAGADRIGTSAGVALVTG
jgi:deoxyribose-phosphate aldolase